MAHIEDYALIGDLRTAALVAADGSIDWLCLPSFDSAAVFAALLGDPGNGRWTLAPATGARCSRRRYRGDSLILDTDWITAEGQVRVTDFMPPTGPGGQVIRIVEGIAGSVRMQTSLALRMEYGKVVPTLHNVDGHVLATAGHHSVWLSTSITLAELDNCLTADFTVAAGDRVSFVLTAAQVPTPTEPTGALTATAAFWDRWIARCTYDGPWADAVKRSLVILKALTHAPTGGILAAATTSLPENIGGTRNWDYRYCWLRDSSFTLQAFQATGFDEEVTAWKDWLTRAVADNPSDVRIMYGLDGTRHLPERSLDWLGGYQASAPVRIGNAADGQIQNDVWGEALDALCPAHVAGRSRTDGDRRLHQILLRQLEDNWREPDNGIWEVRGPRRHFVHSKAMAWVGVDRLVRSLEHESTAGEIRRLRNLRRTMHDEICDRGFNAALRSFTQCYGSSRLDASVLLLPRYGFLPWSDPRMVGTVDAIQSHLTRDGLVLRYAAGEAGRTNCDGIPGSEGAFLACSFWLADALHGIGRTDEGEALFERLLSLRNDVGLLSEEYDVATGHHLGNTPQAFSHAGIVSTALHLSRQLPDVLASSAIPASESAAS